MSVEDTSKPTDTDNNLLRNADNDDNDDDDEDEACIFCSCSCSKCAARLSFGPIMLGMATLDCRSDDHQQ